MIRSDVEMVPVNDGERPLVRPSDPIKHDPASVQSDHRKRCDATRLALASLVLLGLIHRSYLFVRFRSALETLVENSDGWLTWQFFAPEVLVQNLASALLYLQQTPPLPTLILGLVLEVFAWPLAVTLALLLLQYLISILTSCGLFLLLRSWGNGVLISWATSALFLMSLDLVIMEYNSQAQTFYENLSMLGLVFICWQITELLKHQRSRSAWGVGLCVAGLALTRASYAYFFVLPLGFVVVYGVRPRARILLALTLPVLLIHGCWSAKNAWVYDTVSLSTSSWLGSNLVSGLDNFNAGGLLRKHIVENPTRVPEWFSTFVASRGPRNVWLNVTRESSIPTRYRERDLEIQRALENGNPPRNSVARRVISDHYARAYLDFGIAHPQLIFKKFARAYRLFWQPIRDYSGFHFGGLFFVTRLIHTNHDFTRSIGFLRDGGSQVHLLHAGWVRLASGKAQIQGAPPAGAWIAEESLSLLMNALNWISLHTLVLGLAALALANLWRRDRRSDQAGFLFAFGAFCYIAVVSSIAEYGENMRFRLSVEPVVWALTITSWATVLKAAQKLVSRSSTRKG